MSIKSIIKEEVNESDFDWVDNVDSMKLYSVHELKGGMYYVFHPKENVVNPQRPGSPPPDWVADYEGQTIQVIHNDVVGRRIEFIPHGNISRMRWKENTTSVTLDHKAQIFVYGIFSELQGITESLQDINESDDFEWMDKIPLAHSLVNPPNKGDVLICLPGFQGERFDRPNFGGSGYEEGRIIVVDDVTSFGMDQKIVVWPNVEESKKYWGESINWEAGGASAGIYIKALTYYTGVIIEESDDFNWVKDFIEKGGMSYEYLNNKALEFNPPISSVKSMNIIGDTLRSLGFRMFQTESLLFDDHMEDIIGLYIMNGGVVWTGELDGDYSEHISDFAGTNVEVINGRELFGDLLLKEESDFDWVSDIPDSLTIGEIKSGFSGFRLYFSEGDIVSIKGLISCRLSDVFDPSIVVDGSLDLSNSLYVVTDVLRSRMAIKPLNPNVLKSFNIEWGESHVYVGVEPEDDDMYIHTVDRDTPTSLNESDFDWVNNVDEHSSLLNKAFYFDPIAYSGDKNYESLIQYFKSVGFKSKYDTPERLDDTACGLFTYRDVDDGTLCFVYTSGQFDDSEEYLTHITEFADNEDLLNYKTIELIDARNFVNKTINESNDFDWVVDIPSAPIPLTVDKVKIGLSVTLSKHSRFYDEDEDKYSSNPKNTNGIITSVDELGTLYIQVNWSNKTFNTYNHIDLLVYE